MPVSSIEWASGPKHLDYTIKFAEDPVASPVYPLKYSGKQNVMVHVLFHRFMQEDLVGRRLVVRNWLNQQTRDYPATAFNRLGELPGDITAFEVNLGTQRDLLAALGGAVNMNLLRAELCRTGSSDEEKVSMNLHIIRQRAIVLLPGVMATEIWVDGKKCWPAPGTSRETMIEKLRSDNDGVPNRVATNLKVIQAPGLGETGPYFISKWTGWLNEGLPVLKKGSDTVRYIYVQEYPYDWRYKAEGVISKLMGADDTAVTQLDARPSYSWEKAPALQTIVRVLREKLPFMGRKVAMAGHSTGGIILNGLLRTNEVHRLVSHRYYIATPFYGAPKTYYAFLAGTMMLGRFIEWLVLGEVEMRTLAPNLAVIYYLSPAPNYPLRVARFKTDARKYEYFRVATRNANDAAFMNYFCIAPSNPAENGKATPMVMKAIYRQRFYGDAFLQEGAQSWNRGLEAAADGYYGFCTRDLLIPLARTKVFYSSFKPSGAPATLGPIKYDDRPDGGTRLSYTDIDGDGTVPMESLKGSWAAEQLVRVDANVDHVAVADQKVVWDTIRQSLLS